MAQMKTVVSITPLPLDRDTRTLKIAKAFAERGFRSIVVENRPSAASAAPGLEVITLGLFSRNVKRPSAGDDDNPTKLKSSVRPYLPQVVRDIGHFFIFSFVYLVLRPLLNARDIPEADVYYLHEYRLMPMVHLAAKNKPIIYDAHDYYYGVYEPDKLSWFWRTCFLPYLRFWEKLCIRRSNEVVTINTGAAALMRQEFDCSPHVIRNLHDRRVERAPSKDLRSALGLADSDFLIVVIGNRKPGQVVLPMIQSMLHLPENVHLAFVGRFYDADVKSAKQLNLAHRVHALGPVLSDQIVPYIKTADASALLYFAGSPNGRNILPNGLFQSIAAELPLLYPNLDMINQTLADYSVGKEIDPHDSKSLQTGVEWLLNDKKISKEFKKDLILLQRELDWLTDESKIYEIISKYTF